MTPVPKVTIIIPLHVICDRFFTDLARFSLLDYPDFEILVVSNKKVELPKIQNCRLILTKMDSSSPAEKRDIAHKYAKGEICAFIDDDAYPDRQWLSKAVRHFSDPKVLAVGGPGITPVDDPFMARLGGYVYESEFTSGKLKLRFTAEGQKRTFIKDWPAYNLFIRKKSLEDVNGWGSTFYGGEDTYVCLKLIPKGKILYDPEVVVYHHRRPLFGPHLKQIFNVGMHRGYFFKKYPETSRSMLYFLPAILAFGLMVGFVASVSYRPLLPVYLTAFAVFFMAAWSTVFRKAGPLGGMIAAFGVIATHVAYGIGFIKGLSLGKLDR